MFIILVDTLLSAMHSILVLIDCSLNPSFVRHRKYHFDHNINYFWLVGVHLPIPKPFVGLAKAMFFRGPYQ